MTSEQLVLLCAVTVLALSIGQAIGLIGIWIYEAVSAWRAHRAFVADAPNRMLRLESEIAHNEWCLRNGIINGAPGFMIYYRPKT